MKPQVSGASVLVIAKPDLSGGAVEYTPKWTRGCQMPLSRTEIAARWGVHPSTIDRWTKIGRLRRIKVNPAPGGKVLYTEAEVQRVESQYGIPE